MCFFISSVVFETFLLDVSLDLICLFFCYISRLLLPWMNERNVHMLPVAELLAKECEVSDSEVFLAELWDAQLPVAQVLILGKE